MTGGLDGIDKYEDNTPDNSYQWDLTNRQGRKVAGGVYLAVFQVTDDEGTVHSSSVRVGVIGQ